LRREKGEGLFRSESLESLQRRINDEFVCLGLPYYVRIDDCDVLTGNFEFGIELRCRFVSGEETIELAHEIAEKHLKNTILELF